MIVLPLPTRAADMNGKPITIQLLSLQQQPTLLTVKLGLSAVIPHVRICMGGTGNWPFYHGYFLLSRDAHCATLFYDQIIQA